MTKRVVLIHGCALADGGAGTTGTLIPRLEKEGYEILNFQYGFLSIPMAKLRMSFIAKMLRLVTKPTDKIIAHSNGCSIAAAAMEQGAKFDRIAFLHPALKTIWKIPEKDSCKSITVFHALEDVLTRVAMIMRLLNPVKNIWGGMGTYGAQDPDKRFKNINDKFYHEGIFKPENLSNGWEDKIIKAIK